MGTLICPQEEARLFNMKENILSVLSGPTCPLIRKALINAMDNMLANNIYF